MAGVLPTIINSSLLGKVDTGSASKGGTNAIYGVDGSPIVHDVFMKGLDDDGKWENIPRWHTILMIPFGRGGAGFSVLDVTEPVIENDKGPMHMFTIFNDNMNSKVLIANNLGEVTEHEYSSPSSGMGDSLEAQMAKRNYQEAEDTDGGSESDTTTARDAIAACQSDTSAGVTGGKYRTGGTASCYKGRSFTFDMVAPTTDGSNINKDTLTVFELVGSNMKKTDYQSAKMENGRLIVKFAADKTFNFSGSDTNEAVSDNFTVKLSCHSETGVPYQWDYSKLGETWSTPRIARIPSAETSRRNDLYYDRYVAIMGGGKGSANSCHGSGLYLVDLEKKGEIFGAVKTTDGVDGGNDLVPLNGGPIAIADTDPDGLTLEDGTKLATANGSDIGNSVPNNPVVITPDTTAGIPWRGAMVYINDFEGKITKINLTTSNEYGAEYFSQTTLARLNANKVNQRYSYFGMDAGIGQTDKELWLFGGTGDFANLGLVTNNMDNILYGVKDEDFPYFRHLQDVKIPAPYAAGGGRDPDFIKYTHLGANEATSIDDTVLCVQKSGEGSTTACPDATEKAWRINLDIAGDVQYRKVTGAPKLFKGVVYFPVYQPPEKGGNKCQVGDAYICAADDECGNNVSGLLVEAEGSSLTSIADTADAEAVETDSTTVNPFACKGVRSGILSEIVVFADQLFANVAGPDKDKDTLYQTDSVKGEVSTSRGNWRDSSN
jgi:type IV pilus assembly protein PilY1